MKTVRTAITVLAAAALFAAGSGLFACKKKEPETIKIGAILPLSGNSANYGNWEREAIELAKEEINAKGGIRGRKLEIIYEDDEADPRKATEAMNKLARIDKVPVVIGSWASSSVLAQAPIGNETHTVIMGLAISPKIREAGDYVFRGVPDARLALKELVPYVVAEGDKTVAILYINNDFGVDQADVFKEYYEDMGGTIVLNEGYDGKSTDFRTALTKVKELNPEGVFLVGYAEMGIVLKQAKELGIESHFYSSFPFENEDILETAGIAAEGVIYPFFFDPNSELSKMVEYQAKYKNKYGRRSEGFAAIAYNSIMIIKAVMEKVGFEPENIKEGLYKVTDFPGIFGNVSLDEKGDINIPMLIKTVESGDFVILAK